MQSCERFIEIRNQSLSLFGFKSHAKTTPDFNSAIKQSMQLLVIGVAILLKVIKKE